MQYINIETLELMPEEEYNQELYNPTGMDLEDYEEWAGKDLFIDCYQRAVRRVLVAMHVFNEMLFTEDLDARDRALDYIESLKNHCHALRIFWNSP